MHSSIQVRISSLGNCAKWLILSLAFAWLVGCSTARQNVAKKDPFADEKFSCGENYPNGNARPRQPKAPTAPQVAAGANPYANPAMASGNPAMTNPYTNPMNPAAANSTMANNPATMNNPYAANAMQPSGNPEFANPAYANGARSADNYAANARMNEKMGRTTLGSRKSAGVKTASKEPVVNYGAKLGLTEQDESAVITQTASVAEPTNQVTQAGLKRRQTAAKAFEEEPMEQQSAQTQASFEEFERPANPSRNRGMDVDDEIQIQQKPQAEKRTFSATIDDPVEAAEPAANGDSDSAWYDK